MKSGNPFLLLLCILFSLPVSAGENPIAFNDVNIAYDSANAAYARKKYDRAIQFYESIVMANQHSASLYYNLGNAYYQTGDYAHAILNYERAKKLAPNDEDIAVNLKFANQKTEDKIEAAPEMFLIDLQKKLVALLDERSWSLLCIASLLVSLSFIALFIGSGNQLIKKTGFYLGGAAIIVFIITFFIAKSSYSSSQNHNEAIVTVGAVTVLGSPAESSTKLFILHRGSKVVVKGENNGWLEVTIANGNVGWIKASQVEKI
jgi:tetratricopeptide (TPR) repeat protein